MINFEQAEATVARFLSECNKPEASVSSVSEVKLGWLFYWTSTEHLKAGVSGDVTLNDGLIYIVRETGALKEVESAFVQEQIDAFEDHLERQAVDRGNNIKDLS